MNEEVIKVREAWLKVYRVKYLPQDLKVSHQRGMDRMEPVYTDPDGRTYDQEQFTHMRVHFAAFCAGWQECYNTIAVQQ